MVFDRHNDSTVRYGQALRQLLGVSFMVGLALSAWLITLPPFRGPYVLVLGYGAGLIFFIAGAFLARRGYPPGKSLLGGGMAFLFFATKLGLYVLLPRELLPSMSWYPMGSAMVCFALLILFGAAAWRISSQSVSLMVLALGLYLLRYALPGLSPDARFFGIILSACLLGGWVWLWAIGRHGRIFPCMGMFVLYAGYVYFLRPTLMESAPLAPFTLAVLSMLYALLTSPSLIQPLYGHPYPRFLCFHSAMNTCLFFIAALALLVHADLPLWPAPAIVAAVSTVAAAALCARADNMLLPLFMTQAALGLVLAILLPLPSGPRFIVLAGLCLAPAALGKWRPYRLPQALEYGLIATVFFSSFQVEISPRFVFFGPAGISLSWAYLLGAAGLLLLVARLHEGWASSGTDGKDRTAQEILALVCACVAALMIALHTILKRGDSEMLPLLLSAQGVLYLGLGILAAAPVLILAGLVPVFAAHACYYVYPLLTATTWLDTGIAGLTVYGMAAATFALALAGDYLLRRRLAPETGTTVSFLVAVLPYLPVLALATHHLQAGIPLLYIPPPFMLIALLCLVPAISGRRMPGLTGAGYAFALASAMLYLYALYATPAHRHVWHLPLLAIYLMAAAAFERLGGFGRRRGGWVGQASSHGMVFMLAALGAAALYGWNSGPLFAVALMTLALVLAMAGQASRARAYYHAALVLVVAAILYALLFAHQLAVAATVAIMS